MADVLEREVASHYGLRDLHTRILRNLSASGCDVDRLSVKDLALIDEFHMGGRAATEYVIGKMSLNEDEHALDVGCGLGGATRLLASKFQCRVTGVDLTPEYIAIARDLTWRTGLSDRIEYVGASALAMPLPDGQFDAAINFHVAMNIQNRSGLYGEVARVLKPGAVFCVYDVMKGENDGLHYPVHWADTAETSCLTTPSETAGLLEEAGFVIEDFEERKAFALEFLHERAAALAGGVPLLGVHVLMGRDAPRKIANMIRNIEEGLALPAIMMARRA